MRSLDKQMSGLMAGATFASMLWRMVGTVSGVLAGAVAFYFFGFEGVWFFALAVFIGWQTGERCDHYPSLGSPMPLPIVCERQKQVWECVDNSLSDAGRVRIKLCHYAPNFFVALGALYAAAFAAAEASAPGIYQSWLNLFAPVVGAVKEYVPRAGLLRETLEANGYPERGAFAEHIAVMVRVIVLPAIIPVCVLLAAIFSLYKPITFSSTKAAYANCWLVLAVGVAMLGGHLLVFEWMAIATGIDFERQPMIFTVIFQYHLTNLAVMAEVLVAWEHIFVAYLVLGGAKLLLSARPQFVENGRC